jgi:hypothetical protein
VTTERLVRQYGPWATDAGIAWAEAHGIDLRCEIEAERAAGIRIAASLINQARQRRLRAIDRAIARRGDRLSELHRCGLRAAETTRRERREHRLTVERVNARRDTWRAVCACGWVGSALTSRKAAERRVREERAHIFRPMSSAVEHTTEGAQQEAA